MPHLVTVVLSEETAARLGALTTTTGAPAAELVRAVVEAKYGCQPTPRHRPHREPVARVGRSRQVLPPFEYGGEG